MKKLILIVLGLVVLGGGLYLIDRENKKQDARFCAEIEANSYFDPDTVDRLWNWRHGPDGYPSERFCKLYDEKVKPFPGRR